MPFAFPLALAVSLSSQTPSSPSPSSPLPEVVAKIAPSVVRVSAIGAHRRDAPIAPGTKAPALSAQPVDTATKSLAPEAAVPLSGVDHPTVVNFWATWCGPCVHEMPELAKAAQRLAGRVAFVGVATKDSPIDDILAVAGKAGVAYPLYRGGAEDWNVSAFPSTFIVDKDGVVRWSGSSALTALELDVALASVLGGSAAAPGERVLAVGFATNSDVVVTTRDVLQYGSELVAVSSDGVAHDVLGALADDDVTGLALLKIDAAHGALAPVAFAPLASAPLASAPLASGGAKEPPAAFAFGVRATAVDDAPVGAAIVDDDARLVALKLEHGNVPGERVRALVAGVKSDAALQRVGPDVRRNLIISAVFFGLIALGFIVPIVVGRVRRRSVAKQRVGWSARN